MRAGDKVKANTGVAGFNAGDTGRVNSVDGGYVYVKMDKSPTEVEYYRGELEVIQAATDAQHSFIKKAEARQIIKAQKSVIKEAQKIIAEMQKVLDS